MPEENEEEEGDLLGAMLDMDKKMDDEGEDSDVNVDDIWVYNSGK